MQLWLIPLLPLAGFAVNGLFGRRLPKTAINAVAVGSVLLSFLWVLKTLGTLGVFGGGDPVDLFGREAAEAADLPLHGPTFDGAWILPAHINRGRCWFETREGDSGAADCEHSERNNDDPLDEAIASYFFSAWDVHDDSAYRRAVWWPWTVWGVSC